jgi:hypothetical protein
MRFNLMRMLAVVVSFAMLGLVGGVGLATAQPQPGVGKQNVVQVQGTGADGTKFNGQFVATAAKAVEEKAGPASSDENGATSSNTGAAVTGQLTGKLIAPGQPGRGTEPGDRGAARDVNISGFAMPLTAVSSSGAAAGESQAACGILDLTLGPLDLNLLGLRVQLNQVHLVITAIPGGGLLGDLLCAVANLLSPAGGITDLTQFLTALTDLLNALGG